ncbi:hypothetical protein SNE40_010175 [Patella caerulea]|uniref:Protein FAM98A n=1 Tax=Patella caerulea TaxID=87958 RepID=A0AAN8JST7_PATCE
MENDILDSLEDLGYNGEVVDENTLNSAVKDESISPNYSQVVVWVTQELKQFCGLEENVNAITTCNPDDAQNFLLEISGFLREYGCPHTIFSEGPVNHRLSSRQNKLQLLDYLLTELTAVKILASKKPSALRNNTTQQDDKPKESETAAVLKALLIALNFPKPPDNITAFQLFSKVEAKVKELTAQNPSLFGEPLLKARLSDKQWQDVLEVNRILTEEYRIRREMLLKRVDVTIQSFKWSEKAKRNENKIAEVYQPIRQKLTSKSNIDVAQILAARDDLTRLQKTSSGEARERTKCAINRVLIGKVPDRGGRAFELEPPPPEMPAFMKRSDTPSGGRGGRGGSAGGRGGGRGGRIQGGWGDSNSQSHGGNWNQGGGGYQGGGGGYQGGGGGYQGGGGGYQGGGGGYQGGGGGYQGGGGGYQGGGGGYHGGGGGGGRGGRGGRGRGGRGGRGRDGY